MARLRKPSRPQFSLRRLLAAVTWLALVIAICVGQQQAATRQREVIEQYKAAGVLPPTVVNGRVVTPTPQAPPPGAPSPHAQVR